MISNTRKLVQDPYGNYVVQYLLDLRRPELTLGIALGLQGAFVELSLQKFSSNVIEKCLRAGDGRVISVVCAEVTESSQLGQLLHDKFANYVLQTILTVGADAEVQRDHDLLSISATFT